MKNTKVLLSVRSVKKYFPIKGKSAFSKKRVLKANEDISFDVYEGETFALVGESGSGKSTLGKCIVRLHEPTFGEIVYYQGENPVSITECKPQRMRALRKDLQIIFQDPYSSLNPKMTVASLIAEGVITHGYYKKNSKELQEYVLGIMQKCGLSIDALNRYPHQFSGGQRQRVCIARALAIKPKFIVCDECVSALDASVQSQILNLLMQLKTQEKLTYLFITHDLGVVRHIADRVAVMYLGEIVEIGENERIFSSPLHPYTIALLSAMPTIDGEKKERILLGSQLPSAIRPPTGCKFHTRCFMAQEICKTHAPKLEKAENGNLVRCHFAQIKTEEKEKMSAKKGEKE